MNTEIKLVKKPEIAHRLSEIGANVTARINDLGIETLIATEETVKGLKELRADLNKELSGFEEQRKFVKNGILNPYNEFEAIYKNEVSEKYTGAISILKDKIASVETKIKDEKANILKQYFEELILAEKIDFLKWDNLNIDVNLSTSEKKYKDQINEFINKTNEDLSLIKSTDYQAEIMAEYKKTLNVAKSITDVKARKDQERIEAERIRQAEISRRVKQVESLMMDYVDMTDAYEYNDQIYIRKSDLEDLSKQDFEKKMVELESVIATKLKEEAAKEPKTPGHEPQKEKPAEAINAPKTTEPKQEIVTASFKVEGTMSQLRALGVYMKENQIKYSNI